MPSTPVESLTALLRAAADGDAAAVAALLDAHPDLINERGRLDGHSGLRTALHLGSHHIEVVRVLLQRGADPNIRDEGDNAFPLHFVVERGDLATARLLVEHGALTVAGDVDDHRLDIIGWATCFPGIEINHDLVAYLLAHGARHTLHSAVAVGDIDSIRVRAAEDPAALERPLDSASRARRAVHLAVLKGQPDALATLLELGADPQAPDAAGLTALDEAALRGHVEMCEILLRHGARHTIASAIALGDDEALAARLREDPGALRPGGSHASLIVRAAASAPAATIEALIHHGADVNAVEDASTAVDGTLGYTALHAAAFSGNLPAIDVLLTHGARLRRESRYHGSPLGGANYANRREAFERLLKAEIDIFDAIEFDQPDALSKILERDPEAATRPFSSYLPPGAPALSRDATPLIFATRVEKPRAVRRLAASGAELSTGGHLAATAEERTGAFLRMACLDFAVYGAVRSAHAHAAVRLLRRHPELARADIFTATACGDVVELRRLLEADSQRARRAGGPRQWEPILYLCTARLPGFPPASDNAVEVARLLLDAGADPNAVYTGGSEGIRYTALTSVIGRGEEQAAQHPRARELAALLLERGAEPYDVQVLYNGFAGHASFGRLRDDDLVWLLELLYQASLKRRREADWRDPNWPMLGMGGYGDGAWYLLEMALRGNHLSTAEWVLSHGGNPSPPPARDPRTPSGTLYEEAVARGLDEFAALLARYGASAPTPAPGHVPVHRRLIQAAEYNQVAVVRRLLDEGASPGLTDDNGTTPLHAAAYAGSLEVAKLLVERGAAIDPIDRVHGTTPIFWAHYGQRQAVVDYLAAYTRDVWVLVGHGKLERLRQVLEEDPRRARVSWEGGTPLFLLPEDEDVAAEIVRLFVAHGADLSFRRKDGATAERLARARGLTRVADLLEPRT